MSRRVKLPVREKGPEDLHILFLRGWEDPWHHLRETPFGGLLTQIDQATEDHAFRRWTRPLAQALGLPPEGCLLKVPSAHRSCYRRRDCPLHSKTRCNMGHPLMPWCLEPSGIEDEGVRKALMAAVTEWREGTYIVVVT